MKPPELTAQAAAKELESVMKRVREAQSTIALAIEPGTPSSPPAALVPSAPPYSPGRVILRLPLNVCASPLWFSCRRGGEATLRQSLPSAAAFPLEDALSLPLEDPQEEVALETQVGTSCWASAFSLGFSLLVKLNFFLDLAG